MKKRLSTIRMKRIRAQDERDRRTRLAFQDFAAMYGLHVGAAGLRRLAAAAAEHERRADAHHTAAALIRELIAAVHGPGYNSPVWTLAPSHPTQTDGAGAPGRTADSGASASPADSSAAGAPGVHRRPR